jgi:ectoine hydroxylase-related dioxygenase (phytanoyl-CoA dioxygenase family)
VIIASTFLYALAVTHKTDIENYNIANNHYFKAHQQHLLQSPTNKLWIDENLAESEIANSKIPDELKEISKNFIKNGFVVISGGLTNDMIDVALKKFNVWCSDKQSECNSKKDSHGHLPRLMNLHNSVEEVLDLLTQNNKVMEIVDFLFGAKTSIYTSLFFSRGTEQPIHVDIPFFWTVPGARYFGWWTALEDVDKDNGPLRVLVGGHKCNLLDERDKLPELLKKRGSVENVKNIDHEAFYIYANATLENCRKMNITTYQDVYLKKGDVIIWHPLLSHGGSPIRDINRTRYSLVAHVVPEMTPVYKTDVFFNKDLPLSPKPIWNYFSQANKNEKSISYRLIATGNHFITVFGDNY